MNRSPHIVHISTVSSPRSGVGGIVHSIADAAHEYGIRSTIIAGYGKSADSDYVLEGAMGYRLNALRSRMWSEDGFLVSGASRKMSVLLENLRPDLIHIHNLHGYYCDIMTLMKTIRNLKVPTVITMHDLWLVTGRCAHPPGGNLCKSCDDCRFRSRYPAKWIGGRSMMEIKRHLLKDSQVVVPTQWMADRVGEYRPEVIRHGIDTGIFKAPVRRKRKRSQIFAVATRWSREKGLDSIMRLADVLPKDYRIVLAGAGAKQYKGIVPVGPIEDARRLAEYMSESEVLISASREESFGLTVAEALACGTPAIVRRGTATEELIGANGPSFAVDFDSRDEVLSALGRIDEYRIDENMVRSLEAMNSEYYRVYKRLI